jgi:hypothetical protein
MILILLAVGLLLVGIAILVWYLVTRDNTVVVGPTVVSGENGGVTSPDNPQASTEPAKIIPVANAYVPVAPATTVALYKPPPVPAATPTYFVGLPEIVLIDIEKSLVSGGTRAFHIGEVIVYAADGRKLTPLDFEYAIYNKGAGGLQNSYPAKNAIDGNRNTFTHTDGETMELHQLRLKLKIPTKLKQVHIVNRLDCCGDRLEGAVIKYTSSNGTVVATQRLTSAIEQTMS